MILTGAALPVPSEQGLPSLLMLYLYLLTPSPTCHVASLPTARRGSFCPSSSLAKIFCVVAPFAFPPPGTCMNHAERSLC